MVSVETSLDAIGEEKKLSYFRRRIRDFNEDSSARAETLEQFRLWLEGLDLQTICTSYQRLYYPTYLNLFSAVGRRWKTDELQRLAVKNVKSKVWAESEFYHWLLRLPEVAAAAGGGAPVNLSGWDTGLIRSLLARGRGLVMCTYRFGLVRFLSVELAMQGFRVWEAVNRPTFELMQPALDFLTAKLDGEGAAVEGEATAANVCLLNTVNAEEAGCTVQLVDALRRGEVVGLCVEGNTGSDGPWGETSRTVVKFLDHHIAVKNGAARLAAALGAPVLPVVAVRDGEGFGRVVFGDPSVPSRLLRPAEADQFVQDTMQSLYGLLEHYALRYPEQWEGWSALHRWRLREGAPERRARAGLDEEAAKVAELLRGGKRLRVNTQRVAPLDTKDGMMWMDLQTLKSYQSPAWAGDILRELSDRDGVDLLRVEGRSGDPAYHTKLYHLLAYLSELGLVAAG